MSNQYQELKSSTTLVCCGSAPAAGRTNGHGALKEGSGIRLHALAESPAGGAGRGSPGQAGDRPVQITPPAGAEGSGGYDPEEAPRQRVSEIQIQVGSIEVYLPRDAPADYLAALVKEMA